jgi:hypothetical protein
MSALKGKPSLTAKEEAAIEAWKQLAKTWPKTLLIGSDCENPNRCIIWKKSEPGVHYQVGKVNIRNMDEN